MGERESALTVRFGRFLLDSHRRELLLDGVPVPIGGRAFDVLIVLIEGRGQLVTKDELLSRVWPGRFVEENCLQFHISALRKALGSDRDFIKTIAGRGYRFIADVSTYVRPNSAGAGETPSATTVQARSSDTSGYETKYTALSDLFAAHKPAAWIANSGGARSGTDVEACSLAELAKAWIAAPGQPNHLEVVVPAVSALLRLVENEPALTPERLLLMLSIGAFALGRHDCSSRPRERLVA